MRITPAIKKFEALHEQQIMNLVLERAEIFFGQRTAEDFFAKFEEGENEHGEFTERKLFSVDWEKQLEDELADAFHYTAIIWIKNMPEEEWNSFCLEHFQTILER